MHEWILGLASWREMHGYEGGERSGDSDLLQEGIDATGAIIMGKRMFGGWDGPWGDEPTVGVWGENPPFAVPVFVLTHYEREPITVGQTTFTFVSDGIESALEQTRVVESPSGVTHLRYEVVKP